jgi:hypothetical protein
LNTTSVVDGGEVADDLDVLVDLVAALQVNLAVPSHIVIGPPGWSELRKLETAQNNKTSLLGAPPTLDSFCAVPRPNRIGNFTIAADGSKKRGPRARLPSSSVVRPAGAARAHNARRAA